MVSCLFFGVETLSGTLLSKVSGGTPTNARTSTALGFKGAQQVHPTPASNSSQLLFASS